MVVRTGYERYIIIRCLVPANDWQLVGSYALMIVTNVGSLMLCWVVGKHLGNTQWIKNVRNAELDVGLYENMEK